MPEQHAVPVRYRDDVEVRRPNEDRISEEIIDAMRGIAETGLDRYRHAVRPSHAKSHGLLKGEMRVLDGLPELWPKACSRRRACSRSSCAWRRSRATSWPTASRPSEACRSR